MTTVIRIGVAPYEGDTHAVLQRAVDDAARAGGGTVQIPRGVFRMHDALHLRSGVRVVGKAGTILRKEPSVSSPVADFIGYGLYDVTVRDPRLFSPGMGIHVFDDNAGGFYTTVATVVSRHGKTLNISRPLNHDYHVSANARAVSVFPIIDGEGVEDVSLERITLDGNASAQEMELNGCRGGGVILIRSHRVSMHRLEVHNLRTDGISFQQCTDISVEDCHIHHNTGHGLHPGSGSVRYRMLRNHVHDNGRCGLYYCLRTTHSLCQANRLERNAGPGISVGERDTHHRIDGNFIAQNGGPAILFRTRLIHGGDHVVILGNTLGANGRTRADAEIVIAAGLRDIHIAGNVFRGSRLAPLAIEKGAREIFFADNTRKNQLLTAADVRGHAAAIIDGPFHHPTLGPAELPLDGARHLGIEKLRPYAV